LTKTENKQINKVLQNNWSHPLLLEY